MSKKKRRKHPSQKERAYEQYLASFPEWYWVHGLHDARIISVHTDITFVPQTDRPFHNCLALEIDSRASYEEDIRTIYLFNYIWDADDVHLLDMSWWLGDTLNGTEGKWHLNLTVDTSDFVEKTVDIRFESAYVI